MSKFNVGDIVIGNTKANEYGITKQGVLLKVTCLSFNNKYFGGQIIDSKGVHSTKFPKPFDGLKCERFDMYKPKEPTNLATGNEESLSIISITCHGNKVVAKMVASQVSAEARCNPTDTFDYKVGAKLALERLLNKITISVNDTVKIKTLAYSIYTDYERFVELVLPNYVTNLVKGKKPDLSKQYVVLAKHQHLDVPTQGMVYIIQDKDTSQVFVVAERGIEKISE